MCTNYHGGQPCFMFTGFIASEKKTLLPIISKLNGLHIYNPADTQAFLPGCTHVIAKKPARSLKFLSALASGKWILVDKYIIDSGAAGHWLSEEDYEWGEKFGTPGISSQILQAPKRWRIALTVRKEEAPFYGWRVGLQVAKQFDVYRRLIEVGGGTASRVDGSVAETFTHILVDEELKRKVVHFQDRGIPCLRCEYLAHCIFEEPRPSPASCSVFADNGNCYVKLDKCDSLLSPQTLRQLKTGHGQSSSDSNVALLASPSLPGALEKLPRREGVRSGWESRTPPLFPSPLKVSHGANLKREDVVHIKDLCYDPPSQSPRDSEVRGSALFAKRDVPDASKQARLPARSLSPISEQENTPKLEHSFAPKPTAVSDAGASVKRQLGAKAHVSEKSGVSATPQDTTLVSARGENSSAKSFQTNSGLRHTGKLNAFAKTRIIAQTKVSVAEKSTVPAKPRESLTDVCGARDSRHKPAEVGRRTCSLDEIEKRASESAVQFVSFIERHVDSSTKLTTSIKHCARRSLDLNQRDKATAPSGKKQDASTNRINERASSSATSNRPVISDVIDLTEDDSDLDPLPASPVSIHGSSSDDNSPPGKTARAPSHSQDLREKSVVSSSQPSTRFQESVAGSGPGKASDHSAFSSQPNPVTLKMQDAIVPEVSASFTLTASTVPSSASTTTEKQAPFEQQSTPTSVRFANLAVSKSAQVDDEMAQPASSQGHPAKGTNVTCSSADSARAVDAGTSAFTASSASPVVTGVELEADNQSPPRSASTAQTTPKLAEELSTGAVARPSASNAGRAHAGGASNGPAKLVTRGGDSASNVSRQPRDPELKCFDHVPLWLREKRHRLEVALNKLKKQRQDLVTPSESEVRSQENSPRAARYGKAQMSMTECFASANHPRSVLYVCSKFLSATAYPPPDLLYLVMRKYLLDTSNRVEVSAAIAFLNATLLLHPPTSKHIREDDIYAKAMAITFSTESSLLNAVKLNLHRRGFMWNEPKQDSAEWSFFASVVRQALEAGDVERSIRTVALLAFLTSVIEKDNNLTRRMFWSNSSNFILTSALKQLLKRLRKSIESVPPEPCQSVPENAEPDLVFDDVGSDDDDTESDEEPSREIDTLHKDVVTCLGRVVTAVDKVLRENNPNPQFANPLVAGLAKVFSDASHVTLERLFSLLPSSLTIHACRALLECNCRTDLAKVGQGADLTLHAIVARHMAFVPKVPTTATSEWIVTDPPPGRSSTCADVNSDHSDKENEKAQTCLTPSGSKLSSATVNKRNTKGETALHRACITNNPERVVHLLTIPGVDPNARDHAGWTPLSEACNHGHLECVQELLRLPVASIPATQPSGIGEPSTAPPLCIDLLASPQEGTTPLHDALSFGHIEVARALVEKGGVGLLYAIDQRGRTPLDVCPNEGTRSLILEIACYIASQSVDSEPEVNDSRPSSEFSSISLPTDEEYVAVLPPSSLMTSPQWNDLCMAYVSTLCQLVFCYVVESGLADVIRLLCDGDADIKCLSPSPDLLRAYDDIQLLESDICYVLNWTSVENLLMQHVRKMSGELSYKLPKHCQVFANLNVTVLAESFKS